MAQTQLGSHKQCRKEDPKMKITIEASEKEIASLAQKLQKLIGKYISASLYVTDFDDGESRQEEEDRS